MTTIAARLDDDFFRAALEGSTDCVIVTDAQGMLRFINPAGVHLMHIYDRGDMFYSALAPDSLTTLAHLTISICW